MPRITEHEIIPSPSQIEPRPGIFRLQADTVMVAGTGCDEIARYFAEVLAPATGFMLRVQAEETAHAISLRLDDEQEAWGVEGYRLSINPNRVEIVAHRPAGLFYACQTLRQLLPREIFNATPVTVAWELPCGIITDQPRFTWRGIMLDVARHFYPKAFIFRCIDLLALYKMNRLHLHLTDGSAWTLEIPAFPLLTAGLEEPRPGPPARGRYTPADIREIVAYADARQVMIVPEIDFPAHADAFLLRYPELLCVNHPAQTGGDGPMEYCPGREDVFQAFDAILTEVASLFSGPYLHIGGDEYSGTAWEQCPDCQRRIAEEGLEAEDTPELRRLFAHCQGSPRKYLLYRYLMRRVAQIAVDKGKIPVLWDDLAWQGNFPAHSVILQWHYDGFFDWMHQTTTPVNPALEAVRAGHPAVIAPASHHYFDYYDGARVTRRIYEFEPVPAEATANEADLILGPHACLWEQPQNQVDVMLFPRLLALAEQGWTAPNLRRWEHFAPRLQAHLPRLDLLGVRYAVPSADLATLVLPWHYPALGWTLHDWWVNDILTGDGTYTVTLAFSSGKETATMTGIFLTRDGHELPDSVQLVEETQRTLVYHCHVTEYNPDALYSIRTYLRGVGQECAGEITIGR